MARTRPTLDDIERGSSPEWTPAWQRRRPVPELPLLGMSGCWCGEENDHDWDGKADGTPHPRRTTMPENEATARRRDQVSRDLEMYQSVGLIRRFEYDGRTGGKCWRVWTNGGDLTLSELPIAEVFCAALASARRRPTSRRKVITEIRELLAAAPPPPAVPRPADALRLYELAGALLGPAEQ